MTKVFIGGSRKATQLPKAVMERIDNITNSNFTILVGDANGADKSVQKYLASKHYENVIIFCMDGSCRNNIGSWLVRTVVANGGERGFDFYAIKDQQMAQEASYGFMIWDGKSRGTLNNIINLLKLSKKILVFFAPDKSFYTLHELQELSSLLSRCNEEDIAVFEKKLSINQLLQPQHHQLELA